MPDKNISVLIKDLAALAVTIAALRFRTRGLLFLSLYLNLCR